MKNTNYGGQMSPNINSCNKYSCLQLPQEKAGTLATLTVPSCLYLQEERRGQSSLQGGAPARPPPTSPPILRAGRLACCPGG